MPNIKSQKDRVRLTAKQTVRNKTTRTAMRTSIKKAHASVESGDANMTEVIRVASSVIDKAATKGLLHRNTASRKISRLAKRANKVSAAQ